MGKKIRIILEPASHSEDWWEENKDTIEGKAKKAIALLAYEAGEKSILAISMLIGLLLFFVGLFIGLHGY